MLLASAALLATGVHAGPPYLTDDPEPVETGHWEFEGAFQWSWQSHAASGTCPHVEANYGAAQGLQLHVIVPFVLSTSRGAGANYGLGDIELGAKYRFIGEGPRHPQIGVFPLLSVPAGSEKRGLGSGEVEALLPVWLQKSFGPWTTYGGAGIHLARGENAGIAGWLLQRQISDGLTFGAEGYLTFPFVDGDIQTQFNAGLVADFTDHHHLLFSAGPSFGSADRGQAYLAYQLTL